jgi:hypothetical protein
VKSRTIVVRSVALALGVFTLLVAWGLSSPPGSTPDDDFHTVSILCANGDNEFCQILEKDSNGKPTAAIVPLRAANNCFFTSFPSEDGSCIAQQIGLKTETTRIGSDHVSGLYYTVMNRFLGSDYETSIRDMRIFNAFLFSALLFLALLTGVSRVRRGVVLLVLTALIPFASFFVPSINPSSWAITGVVFSWVFLYSLIHLLKPQISWWRIAGVSFGLLLSLVVALGGRKDPQIYLIVVLIATVILEWPRLKTKFKWLLVALTGVAGVIGYLIQADRLEGFITVISESLFNPGVLIESLVELPSVIAGTIGSSTPIFRSINFFYYGVGWHEVQMPTSVILITLATLGGLVFTFLPGARKRQLAAVGFVVVSMVATQMYVVAVAIGQYDPITSPRYMAPLFLTAVVIFFSTAKVGRKFPSRGQAVWLFLAMPLASAIALLTTIRRYTNGQGETWFKLFFGPNWWWEDFPLNPTAVWFLGLGGSLLAAYSAIGLLRKPKAGSESASWRDYTPRIVFAFSWLFSLISAWSLLRLPGELNPAANLFRGYFPTDQLSYAGISASAKAGSFGLVEPFTQTGVSFYPSWWYKIIGQFASYTGMEIPAAWSFLGLVVVLGSIAFIGFAAYRVTGKAWAPLVLGVLLWIGPLSAVLFDNWYVNLSSHAVMWGPYGALYPLNAEAVGLAIGSAALALGYWTLRRPAWGPRRRIVLFGLAGLGIGITANFQTYSFLTLTAVAFWVLAVAGLQRSKSRNLLIATIAILVSALVLGTLMRETIGALPVYVLMLIPTLPGLWYFAQKRLVLVSVGLFFFALGAAPQVFWMISGTLAKDPFLTYRVDQSGDLGVPLWAFVLIGSPILVTWALILWVQIYRRGVAEIALLVGWFIAFMLLSFNNLWGFGQEPYRFWIDSVIVFTVVATLTLPPGVAAALRSNVRMRILAALAVVLIGASVWNVGGFREYVAEQGNIDFDSPRLLALNELVGAEPLDPGLVTSESCIDPRTLKVVTGVPVAFYNLGLAWPEKKAEIDALIEATNAGVLDVELMRAAGVSYLVTDTGCPTQWQPEGNLGVAQFSSIQYSTDQGDQRLELWRIL